MIFTASERWRRIVSAGHQQSPSFCAAPTLSTLDSPVQEESTTSRSQSLTLREPAADPSTAVYSDSVNRIVTIRVRRSAGKIDIQTAYTKWKGPSMDLFVQVGHLYSGQ